MMKFPKLYFAELWRNINIIFKINNVFNNLRSKSKFFCRGFLKFGANLFNYFFHLGFFVFARSYKLGIIKS